MKIHHYCYTRGEKPDYRDFIIPGNICYKDMMAVRDLVKPILAYVFTSDQLSHPPIWVLYKTTDVVVWGVCCWNKDLSPQQCNTDEKGRNVRGFFSVVLSDFSVFDLRIPYDISYFEKLYEEEVCPHWFCSDGEQFGCTGRDLLTLDTITLAIGYDGTDNISNTKVIFMNSILPGKKEKTVPVKRPCPSCGKLVSHYSYSGICEECTGKTVQVKTIIDIDKEKDMEQEFTELKRQLRDCHFEIDEKDKKIKRQNRLIKVLWIACGLLLILSLWLFKNSNIKINTDLASNSSAYREMVSNDNQEPELFLMIESQKVEVLAEGQDSVVVGWKTNYPKVEVKISEVNWAKITSNTNSSIILSIKANESPNERLAQIKIMPSGGKEKIIELHQMSAK